MTHAGWNMQGQNIRHKVQIVIFGAFNNKSVHFVGVIIVWLSTCTEGQQLKKRKVCFTAVVRLLNISMSSRAKFVAVDSRVEGQFLRDTENRVTFLTLRDGTLETSTVNWGRTLLLLLLLYICMVFCCLKYEHFYVKITLIVQIIVYKCGDDYIWWYIC
jgi:hypothetical protein